jgi:hypothetical protein
VEHIRHSKENNMPVEGRKLSDILAAHGITSTTCVMPRLPDQNLDAKNNYGQKSPDAQDFVDKHTVDKHEDYNGNGDEFFKATNVDTIDRPSTRHGYNQGQDVDVYEDEDHDNDDLPKRAGTETVKCSKCGKKYYSQSPVKGTHYCGECFGLKKEDEITPEDLIAEYLESLNEDEQEKALMILEQGTEEEIEDFLSFLEDNLLTEISRKTAASYISKAADSLNDLGYKAAIVKRNVNHEDYAKRKSNQIHKKTQKRFEGVQRAVRKLSEDEQQLNEYSDWELFVNGKYVDTIHHQGRTAESVRKDLVSKGHPAGVLVRKKRRKKK